MWVFAYGSLLWNPGFDPIQSQPAVVAGFRRSFSMRSIHHRGTEDDPGLVLALDESHGDHCMGLALKVAAQEEAEVLAELRARELISSAYVERWIPAVLPSGETVETLAYVIEKSHVQYCQLDLEEQAQIIARAVGGRGPNWEYLANTCAKFDQIGIEDADLTWLNERVNNLRQSSG